MSPGDIHLDGAFMDRVRVALDLVRGDRTWIKTPKKDLLMGYKSPRSRGFQWAVPRYGIGGTVAVLDEVRDTPHRRVQIRLTEADEGTLCLSVAFEFQYTTDPPEMWRVDPHNPSVQVAQLGDNAMDVPDCGGRGSVQWRLPFGLHPDLHHGLGLEYPLVALMGHRLNGFCHRFYTWDAITASRLRRARAVMGALPPYNPNADDKENKLRHLDAETNLQRELEALPAARDLRRTENAIFLKKIGVG